ncbi:MAG TPA: PilZ domain-containing protein [Geothermobacteraceae bacterium]|nr:PilZ domain-containing protein [Geothermobacteraceae bacterium]
MLEESLPPRKDEKRVWLEVGRPGLKAFLEVMLREWRYLPGSEAVAGGLLLAEEGMIDPPPQQETIWLSPSASASRRQLQFPIDISALYALLERRYHNPPRCHLRLSLETVCELVTADDHQPATLASISDRGCRLKFSVELARDARVELCLDLANLPTCLPGKVIYCVPRYQADHQLYYDLGLLFSAIERKLCDELLDYIIASYFTKAKRQLSAAEFNSALGCFNVSDAVKNYLAERLAV